MTPSDESTRTRRKLQFGTRAVFFIVAVAAVLALLLAKRHQRAMDQRRLVSEVLESGGEVFYAHQKSEPHLANTFDPRAQPPGPKWMRALVGSDHFDDVVMVSLRDQPITDDDLKQLAKLSQLENLNLSNTSITSDGLAHLKQLQNLKDLSLWNTQVDDEGLAHLAVHKNLRQLVLDGTNVTDAGLEHLQDLTELQDWLGLCDTAVTDEGIQCLGRLKKLKSLNLRRTKVTADGAKQLRRSLPTTAITVGP